MNGDMDLQLFECPTCADTDVFGQLAPIDLKLHQELFWGYYRIAASGDWPIESVREIEVTMELRWDRGPRRWSNAFDKSFKVNNYKYNVEIYTSPSMRGLASELFDLVIDVSEVGRRELVERLDNYERTVIVAKFDWLVGTIRISGLSPMFRDYWWGPDKEGQIRFWGSVEAMDPWQ